MSSLTANTAYNAFAQTIAGNAATGVTVMYYEITAADAISIEYSHCYSSTPEIYCEYNPDIWTAPRTAPKIDIKRDRPNKQIVHNRVRHISPMHFRHVRTQQRKV